MNTAAIWHDLDYAPVSTDEALWLELCQKYAPASDRERTVLDVGAGTGRISIPLAHAGFRVTGIDVDGELLIELARRAMRERTQGGVGVIRADAREWRVRTVFDLIVVPMNTIQMLGPGEQRARFLGHAHAMLATGGKLIVSIMDEDSTDLYDGETDPDAVGEPDRVKVDGVYYESYPIAVRKHPDRFELVRERVTCRSLDGDADSAQLHAVTLWRVSPIRLLRETAETGFRLLESRKAGATDEHAGSLIFAFARRGDPC